MVFRRTRASSLDFVLEASTSDSRVRCFNIGSLTQHQIRIDGITGIALVLAVD
jgi:hypothetical protein